MHQLSFETKDFIEKVIIEMVFNDGIALIKIANVWLLNETFLS